MLLDSCYPAVLILCMYVMSEHQLNVLVISLGLKSVLNVPLLIIVHIAA